jgi:hypothetical protein
LLGVSFSSQRNIAGLTWASAAHATRPSSSVSDVYRPEGWGKPMDYTLDDCAKRRLTERDDIITAVRILRSRGVRDDELVFEMAKIFYIDLDEFNDVMSFDLLEQVMELGEAEDLDDLDEYEDEVSQAA